MAGSRCSRAKHSHNPVRNHSLDDELLGIAVALSAGELDEARFIYHTKLGRKGRRQIADINAVLSEWEADSWRRLEKGGTVFTAKEIETRNKGRAPTIKFIENCDWRLP